MARTLTHKYVHYENGGDPMEVLFDMEADPWETRNVLAEAAHAEALAESAHQRFGGSEDVPWGGACA